VALGRKRTNGRTKRWTYLQARKRRAVDRPTVRLTCEKEKKKAGEGKVES